ncbi:FkbM family methyltransferase [Bizionia myxarmorum]|uniref:FkbM family methyltransferase n=1 Tax=Bizionia myxarmorum TaxID=291186 RepID=A0A5D0R7E4_9FLAO|nr:FkbM family methyltransferase [Bizionia myxarmorum]TYB77009.1 FkbM family methyltransferase [Bizionia myxarmorum]
MQIKKIIKSLSYRIKNQEQHFTSSLLCGVPLKLLAGTIREKVDQDDAWWFYLAKHHAVIFDIGCNIGYTALLALIQDPRRPIVLVDPNPKALQKSAMNIIQNNLGSRVQYLSAFVGDKLDETVKFYTVGAGAAGSMYASHAETASAMNSFIDVNTLTLDYIYEFYGMKPDLVKIDVEGAEILVMKSAKKLTAETQCTYFVEMHTVENLGMEAAGQYMLNWCTEMNYNAWYLKTGELLTHAATIRNRGKCHLLLLPKSKEYPDYLVNIKQNAPLPNSI